MLVCISYFSVFVSVCVCSLVCNWVCWRKKKCNYLCSQCRSVEFREKRCFYNKIYLFFNCCHLQYFFFYTAHRTPQFIFLVFSCCFCTWSDKLSVCMCEHYVNVFVFCWLCHKKFCFFFWLFCRDLVTF